jgi:hypothetical protein
MPVYKYQPANTDQIYFPQVKSLFRGIPVQWILVTAMAAFFFPLTMTIIMVNEASLALILAALISISIVVITNLLPLSEKYIRPVFGIGICIDLGVIIASFVIK